VVWTASVKVGRGRHEKHRTYVIARGIERRSGAGPMMLTIRLTEIGRRLLRGHLFGLHTIAHERFASAVSRPIIVIRRFTL
jgi:hypothetical protein